MASPFATGKGMSHFPNGQSMAMLDMCENQVSPSVRIRVLFRTNYLVLGINFNLAANKKIPISSALIQWTSNPVTLCGIFYYTAA